MFKRELLIGLVIVIFSATLSSAENGLGCSYAPADTIVNAEGCMIGDLNHDNFVNAQDIIEIKNDPITFWDALNQDFNNLNMYLSGMKQNWGKGEEILIINVKDAFYGAKGDGTTDDGPAIQKALSTEPNKRKKIHFPEGKYFTNQTLVIESKTEISGMGSETVLLRGPRSSTRPWWGASAGSYAPLGNRCERNYGFDSWELFTNSMYNCGNEQIYLHDFAIDGSKVVLETDSGLKVYKQVPGKKEWIPGDWKSNAGTLSFAATQQLRIQNLSIYYASQDAIFIRGGGVDTVISDNVIDSYNLFWYNGGGINIEMWYNSNYLTPKDGAPVKIHRNTIYVRTPGFCQSSQTKRCTKDADCGTSLKCGIPGIAGIVGSYHASPVEVPYPKMSIINNTILISNKHQAISCLGCLDLDIRGNTITSLAPTSAQDEIGGSFGGIQGSAGGESGFTISGNTITGSNKSGDGRGIWVPGMNGKNLLIEKNIIQNRNTQAAAALEISGYSQYVIKENTINGMMKIGYCGHSPTIEGSLKDNSVSPLPIQVRTYENYPTNIIVEGNNFEKKDISYSQCTENTMYGCFDGIDGDWDGRIDCDDLGCDQIISADQKWKCIAEKKVEATIVLK